jgi:murein hydrolase activator
LLISLKNIARYGLFCWFLIGPVLVFSQKKRELLERKKQENLERIKELNAMLDKTAEQKEATVGQLNVLKERIYSQNRQIELLNENQSVLQEELQELERVTGELNGGLGKLKHEYSEMVYQASKPSNALNKLGFLFSSKSFNEFSLRYKWLRQYTDARRKQVLLMENVRNSLLLEQQKVTLKRNEQLGVLKSKVTENKNLEVLKSRQNNVVSQLSQQEGRLRNKVEENKKAIERLEGQIAAIVEREMRRQQQQEQRERSQRIAREREAVARDRQREKETEQPQKDEDSEEEPEVVTSLGGDFSQSKNRLPWPVRGFISSRFGLQHYDVPGLEHLKFINNGIDIQTQAGNNVRVVHEGVVRNIEFVAGVGNMVAIQHGDYWTFYLKLSQVSVRIGQSVKSRDLLGTVAQGNDGTSELQFQIWHYSKNRRNSQKLNPEHWLSSR